MDATRQLQLLCERLEDDINRSDKSAIITCYDDALLFNLNAADYKVFQQYQSLVSKGNTLLRSLANSIPTPPPTPFEKAAMMLQQLAGHCKENDIPTLLMIGNEVPSSVEIAPCAINSNLYVYGNLEQVDVLREALQNSISKNLEAQQH